VAGLNVGELIGLIRADDSPMRLGLANAQLRMRAFRRDVESQLREINYRFREQDWGALMRRAMPHLRAFGQGLGRIAKQAAGPLAAVAMTVGKLGFAVGSAVPMVAGLVTALANIAPAAAVAVSGMIAMRLASGALKLGMIGVEDAVTAALDPSKAEDFEKALKKLAPNARDFARQVKAMAPEFRKLQQSVQNRLFAGLADDLKALGKHVMPTLRKHLEGAAGSLNHMARGAAAAAIELGKNGTLDKALKGANDGLAQLPEAPGQVVTALGQIGAAAGPSFAKLSAKAGEALDKLAAKLTKAFESGAMERAIEEAIGLAGQLLRSVRYILGGLKNIFAGLTTDGRGLFDILENLAKAFRDLTGSKEFQSILTELAKTADELVQQILPLLKEAFVQLGPVIEELAPVVREFLAAIGPELVPVIKELGPILVDVAEILRDQLPMAIVLTKSALGVLVIALQGVHWILENVIQPAVKAVADAFNSDFAKALRFASGVAAAKLGELGTWFNTMRQRIVSSINGGIAALGQFASNLRSQFVRAVAERLAEVVRFFTGLPGRMRAALGDPGAALFNAGAAVVRGFINGIRSQLAALRSQLSSITSMIPDLKGPPEKDARLLTPAGRSVMQGFMGGIASQLPALQRQLGGITTSLPGMTMGPMPAGFAGAAGGVAAAPVVLHLHGDGLRDTLRDIVRDGGGDVQVVLGP